MASHVICTNCGGTGKDSHYGRDFCVTCDGTGRLEVIPLGDEKVFKWNTQNVPVKEFETDIQLSHDMFIWAKIEYAGQDWYKVHATMPVMATIECTLLDAGKINLLDIPGGPNNHNATEMLGHASDAAIRQEKAKAVVAAQVEEAAKKKGYVGYRDKLTQSADAAAKVHIPDAVAPVLDPTPVSAPATSEEPTMSSIPDRLKQGGRTIADVVKEGALIGTVTAANKSAIDILIFKLGDKCPEMFKTPAGRQALELLLPAMMLMATEMDDGNRIPGKEYVSKAATLALKGTSAEAAEALSGALMEHLGIIMMTYAQVGKELADSEAALETASEAPEFQEVKAPAIAVAPPAEKAPTFE